MGAMAIQLNRKKVVHAQEEYWWHLKGRDGPYKEFGAFIRKLRGDGVSAGIGTRRTELFVSDELVYYFLPGPLRAEDIEAVLRKIAKEGVTGKDGIGSIPLSTPCHVS